MRRNPIQRADTRAAASFSSRAVVVTAALLIAVAAWLAPWPQDRPLLAQDAATKKNTAPGRFGAFTPQAFLRASRPFSPDGADQAKKVVEANRARRRRSSHRSPLHRQSDRLSQNAADLQGVPTQF